MRTSVLEYLEASAARRPEGIAVIDETGEYSYRQLLEASRRAGNSLMREGVGGRPVMPAPGLKVGSVLAFEKAGAYCSTEGMASPRIPRVPHCSS